MTAILQSRHLKMLISSFLAISAVLSLLAIFNLVYFYFRSENLAESRARKVTHDAAVMIEERLKGIEGHINGISALIAKRGATPDPEMKQLLEKGLGSNKALFGIVVAYAPYQYSSSERLHSLFAMQKGDRVDFTSVERTYDYTSKEHDWYNRPIREGAVWSKPFWGKASNAMVVTYSVPVVRTAGDGIASHVATVSAVCSLNNINEMVSSLDLGSSGYGFIVYKDGTFVAHPAEQLVRDKVTMTGYAGKNYGKGTQQIIAEGIGSYKPFLYQERTKLTRQMGVISMEPVKSIGWFVGSVLVKAEIGLKQKDAKWHWACCIVALTLFSCSFALFRLRIGEQDTWISKLPISVVILTITFTAGLLAIWATELTLGFPSPYEDAGFLADKRSISKFVATAKEGAGEQLKNPQQVIPTGIMLNTLKVSGIGDVEVSGTIWQKTPNGKSSANIRERVHFPTAMKVSMEEAYHSDGSDATVDGANFSATLMQDFDNTLYPFDRLQVRIPLRQKQLLDNVQLVPDFSSYPVYIPSANPFIIKELFIPGWHVKQTYFSVQKKEYPATYGFADKTVLSDAHDLVLTVTLQRELMAGFISIFLPLIMLAVIMYIALLLSTNDEKKVNILWFRPANMQVVAGSFLLYLVFSTINLRNHVLSDKILYVEYMFFFMYFVILALVVSSVKITLKREESIFGYRDGYVVKSMYWPMVTGSMFLITLVAFF